MANESSYLQVARPTLGLCVIVKDGAATLRACLDSVDGLVDRVVVVDTGSRDGSPGVAREAGAQVIHLPWAGDFSEARNAALAAILTDWVLVLDADEELDEAARGWIRREIEAPRFDAYITPVRNYLRPWDEPLANQLPVPSGKQHQRAPNATHYLHSEVCRLFRRSPGVCYTGVVHEQVEPSLQKLQLAIGQAAFFIHHLGWYRMDDSDFSRKFAFYRDLLSEKLRRSPEDAQVMVQLGDLLLNGFDQPEEALPLLLRAAALSAQTRELWMQLTMCLVKLHRPEAALIAAEQIPANGELAGKRAQLQAEIFEGLSRWEQACATYRLALRYHSGNIQLRARLAYCEARAGRPDEGARLMNWAIAAAESEVRRFPCAQTSLRAAELYAQSFQWEGAMRHIRAGLAQRGCALALEQLRLKAAVALGLLPEAVEAARALIAHSPSPRAYLRQAAILCEAGRQVDAYRSICEGVRHFPDSLDLRRAEREFSTKELFAMSSSSVHSRR